MSLEAILSRLDSDQNDARNRLLEFLAIPSISTDPDYKAEVRRAAEWLRDALIDLGADAELRVTPGHPMVTGRTNGEGRPLLFYGHYDVQPVDPLELWHRDPFDPAIEDDVIRGRGAADDKGQLMTFIEALRAWKSERGTLPNITFLFEGEEESGSPSLVPFLKEHKSELTRDLALICDTGLYAKDRPGIVTQLRGLLGEEIVVRGASKDLHSGSFGGIAQNPIRVLARIVASLHDATGRVTIPGFYEGVPELTDELRAQWDALTFDGPGFLSGVGLSAPAGESDRTALEHIWSRPTAEVNGIRGGYAGKGFKTVLPAEAAAKISFRLVGNQDPLAIRDSFRAMVREMIPEDCTVEFHDHGAGPASHMDTSDPAFEAARQALGQEWPHEAAYIGAGGSIPVAGYFQSILGMDSMLIGFGRDNDQIHSPNEKYDLKSFHLGARSWARILDAIS
ncbi:N-formyl-4-amino-5-aminomethyl-2-methylpyrimidinedeformylase [Rhodobacteraceae bacterium THAF1]|uniref:M20/M25/M40 family metallo-hydrolase n=1 Tax=Palleronia sp. THAF1 TaxID=2587842 RepID=UPI000F3FF7C4|nr:M20/M25/M40 family metallo-hydrolase [Palleronia sp. THAF1]QFU08955.1 N-formyl-4-amino-5-aminomethyl-2-methylpyrimidine deformylase [Palleronia sp. THAF1]VDC24310.1 N-formyl-4-amino-5-aminomethyl-2-methylpyrimidinedeformylase [Rhodobacteraceae bacterium THAF1]